MRRITKIKTTKSQQPKRVIPSDYISLYEAAGLCSYSQEYLSLLARRNLIKSKKFGRNWYLTKKDLAEYCLNNSKDKKGNHRGEINIDLAEETRVIVAKYLKTILKSPQGTKINSEKRINFSWTKLKLISLALVMSVWLVVVMILLPSFVNLVKNDLEIINAFNQATIGRSILASKKSYQSSQSLFRSGYLATTLLVQRGFNSREVSIRENLSDILNLQDKINSSLASQVEENLNNLSDFILLTKLLINKSVITSDSLPNQISVWQNNLFKQRLRVVLSEFINYNQSKYQLLLSVGNGLYFSNQWFVLKFTKIIELRLAQMNILKSSFSETIPVVAGVKETFSEPMPSTSQAQGVVDATEWSSIFSPRQDFEVLAKYIKDFDRLVLEKK